LQRTGKEDSSSPQRDEADYACRYEPESRRLEYSLVEADDGDFEEGAKNEVGELVCEKDL
jgi:hypothetical protein